MIENLAYVAIDPGETSGWAAFDDKGDIIEYGQFPFKAAVPFLRKLLIEGLKGVIVEDFKNHPWAKQRSWDRNNTSKLIGQIEMICGLREIPMCLQPNTVKPIGYMYAGMEPPTNHKISHQYDAYAHGVYWLQTNGIRPVGKAIKDNDNSKESST